MASITSNGGKSKSFNKGLSSEAIDILEGWSEMDADDGENDRTVMDLPGEVDLRKV